jgi:hypothetical protein
LFDGGYEEQTPQINRSKPGRLCPQYSSNADSDSCLRMRIVDTALDVPRGDLGYQSWHALLEIVALERVAPAEATLLDVDGLGVRIFLGAVKSDETRWQFPQWISSVRRSLSRDREKGKSVCDSVPLRLGTVPGRHGTENSRS